MPVAVPFPGGTPIAGLAASGGAVHQPAYGGQTVTSMSPAPAPASTGFMRNPVAGFPSMGGAWNSPGSAMQPVVASPAPSPAMQLAAKYAAASPAPPEAPPGRGPLQSALKIQRWYRSRKRRIRFLHMIRRAVRRRKYLDERRSLAQRIHTREIETDDMKTKLMQPRGHRQVVQWQDSRTTKAAQKVQSMWRKLKARRQYATLAGKMDHETAVRRIQDFARRRLRRRLPNPLVRAAEENPAARPITSERLFKHEEQILKKRNAYIPDPTADAATQAERMEELRRKAMEKYRGFLESRPRERTEVARTYLHREQTRQMLRALEGEGVGFERPLPYGVCSAALLREAEEKHKERKSTLSRDLWATRVPHTGTAIEAATVTVSVESHTEATEADQLLWGLEADLGYDFSAEHAAEPLPSRKTVEEVVFKPMFSSADGLSRVR